MDSETIRALNEINRRFYETTAEAFDQTRGSAWPGWERSLHDVLAHLPAHPTVIDVACGNGRFGLFLAEKVGHRFDYYGLDNNLTLLERARQTLQPHTDTDVTLHLQQVDILEGLPELPPADWVVAFGLLHHIPGFAFRRRLVCDLLDLLAPGGFLTFTSWQFYAHERFQKRIVPWPQALADKVEKHDYLLDWRRGEQALRYCHYVDAEEQEQLIAALGECGGELIDRFLEDGEDHRLNQYLLFRKS